MSFVICWEYLNSPIGAESFERPNLAKRLPNLASGCMPSDEFGSFRTAQAIQHWVVQLEAQTDL